MGRGGRAVVEEGVCRGLWGDEVVRRRHRAVGRGEVGRGGEGGLGWAAEGGCRWDRRGEEGDPVEEEARDEEGRRCVVVEAEVRDEEGRRGVVVEEAEDRDEARRGEVVVGICRTEEGGEGGAMVVGEGRCGCRGYGFRGAASRGEPVCLGSEASYPASHAWGVSTTAPFRDRGHRACSRCR